VESNKGLVDACNLDPGVLALLEPLPDGATKNDIYTRIATIRLKQSHIWGASDYAAKVLEHALEQGSKDRNAHSLLGQRLQDLEAQADQLKQDDNKNEKEEDKKSNGTESAKKKNDETKKTEKEGGGDDGTDDKGEGPVDRAIFEKLQRTANGQSAKITALEKFAEQRLMEEIEAVKDEQESIRKREARLRKRIRSLQLSIEELSNDKDDVDDNDNDGGGCGFGGGDDDDDPEAAGKRRTRLQKAMSEVYASTSVLAGKAECAVCHDLDAVRAVIPCGHLCLCDSCTETLASTKTSKSIQSCPLCRGNLLSTIKIYTTQ